MASSGGSKGKTRPKPVQKPAKPAKPNPKPAPRQAKPARASQPPPPPPPPPSKWVVVQLSSLGEREKNIPIIVRSARQILGVKDLEVFVPAISQKVRDESQTLFYMDGYVFIKYAEGVQYMKLQETTYFNTVLCKPSFVNGERKRAYAMLEDKDLEPMKRGMETLRIGEFSEDDDVKIVKGSFKGLPGKVSFVHDGGEHVQVYVGLRSKQVLMDFPASYLVKLTT